MNIKAFKNDWYKKVIIKNAKEIVSSAITYIILSFVLLLWYFVLGIKFQWQNINPLSEPSFFIRSFYSAFTFCTLGRVLYKVRFYKLLYDIIVRTLGSPELFNAIKAALWIFLMYLSYAYIVPWIFNVLNFSLSLLFNIANLALYAFPPVGIALILSFVYMLPYKKLKLNKL
jgi:hypothetical protein